MRICFFGTSHGVPEPGRSCACTMIEVSGRLYFVDMGMMAIPELVNRGLSIDAVKGVFITHMHGDHTNGLPNFVDLLSWYYKTANPAIYLPKEESIDALNTWINVTTTRTPRLRYAVVQPGIIYEDGFIKVTAIATQHCAYSFAYLVEAEGKQILFTGDLAHPTKDYPEIAKQIPLDLVVCEAAHFSPSQYLSVFRESQIKTVCVNHYVPRYIGDILQLKADLTDAAVYITHDGMELTL